jgi:hypothetical protein
LAIGTFRTITVSQRFFPTFFYNIHQRYYLSCQLTKFILAMSKPRTVKAPTGTDLSCKGWQQEAAFRMIQNNLDPDVAEKPDELIVYGGHGKAAER